jgi:hypothetical protein
MRLAALGIASLAIASCASHALDTIENRLVSIGLSPDHAACMADDLHRRLSSDDVRDLARYARSLSRSETTLEAIDALRGVDNPRAVAAVAQSAIRCIAGFGR